MLLEYRWKGWIPAVWSVSQFLNILFNKIIVMNLLCVCKLMLPSDHVCVVNLHGAFVIVCAKMFEKSLCMLRQKLQFSFSLAIFINIYWSNIIVCLMWIQLWRPILDFSYGTYNVNTLQMPVLFEQGKLICFSVQKSTSRFI